MKDCVSEAQGYLLEIVDSSESLRTHPNEQPVNHWRGLAAGRLAMAAGDVSSSAASLNQALELALGVKNIPAILEILVEIAWVFVKINRLDDGAEILGYLLSHSSLSPTARNRAEKLKREMLLLDAEDHPVEIVPDTTDQDLFSFSKDIIARLSGYDKGA